jgi:hypothetical protein
VHCACGMTSLFCETTPFHCVCVHVLVCPCMFVRMHECVRASGWYMSMAVVVFGGCGSLPAHFATALAPLSLSGSISKFVALSLVTLLFLQVGGGAGAPTTSPHSMPHPLHPAGGSHTGDHRHSAGPHRDAGAHGHGHGHPAAGSHPLHSGGAHHTAPHPAVHGTPVPVLHSGPHHHTPVTHGGTHSVGLGRLEKGVWIYCQQG